MEIKLDTLSPTEVYFNMTQALVPRPIAWVLTENETGTHNLAPFSYFTAICSDPPLILLSIGRKPDGTPKDTRANISRTGEFVVHIATKDMLESINESSATLPADVSEVDMLGLETLPFGDFPLPRLKGCPIAYACKLHDLKEIGPNAQGIIFGEIRSVYIDDTICCEDEKGRLKVDAMKLAPLARLGADEYATLGEIIGKPRPK